MLRLAFIAREISLGASEVERPTVAIITDDAAFANALTRHWLTEREVPAFVLMQGDSEFDAALDFDLAVAVRIGPEKLPAAVDALARMGKPAILVSTMNGNSPRGANLVVLPEVLEWPELAVVVAQQIWQREQSRSSLSRLQEINAQLEREASLGRYMIEVQHNLNNALTSTPSTCPRLFACKSKPSVT